MHTNSAVDYTPGELRSERAYLRRRITALERAERALRRAERDLAELGGAAT